MNGCNLPLSIHGPPISLYVPKHARRLDSPAFPLAGRCNFHILQIGCPLTSIWIARLPVTPPTLVRSSAIHLQSQSLVEALAERGIHSPSMDLDLGQDLRHLMSRSNCPAQCQRPPSFSFYLAWLRRAPCRSEPREFWNHPIDYSSRIISTRPHRPWRQDRQPQIYNFARPP